MRFSDIEVSGIENIVIERKHHWSLIDTNTWKKRLNEGEGFPDTLSPPRTMSHEQMMMVVNVLKKDRRYRMWCHLCTLNIVRKVNGGERQGERPHQ